MNTLKFIITFIGTIVLGALIVGLLQNILPTDRSVSLIIALLIFLDSFMLVFFIVEIFSEKLNKIEQKKQEDELNKYIKMNISSRPFVKKTYNHDEYKPKTTQYKSLEKEKKATIVSESITVYKPEPKTDTEQKKAPLKVKQKEKLKPKEILPPSIKETIKPISDIKYVNYDLKLSESETDFPILKAPNHNCVIRSHRLGSTKRRGFKEASFQRAIEYFFSENFEVLGNARLNTGKNTRPYEPDIAIIGSSNHNIKIDIEIDEPYAGITRQPTHCIGDDINRDNYFKDRGWIVIRFSEFQVHTQEKECLKYIAKIISTVNPSIEIPSDLKTINNITNEKVWDVVQSQKWEKVKYREEYLNHTFQRIEEDKEILKREFDQQETEEEKLVINTTFGQEEIGKNISFNHKNVHNRDSRIKFFSEKHIYTIDGITFPSASTIVSRFFPEFDAWGVASRLSPSNPLYGLEVEEIVRTWNERGQDAANLGTFLHEQIENYYLNQPYEKTEGFYQFENFVNDHPNLNPYRSEWRIFDDNIGVAGTIDLIVKNTQNFDIYDWKRSKKVINTFDGQPIKKDNWGKCGIGQLSHVDDTSYNRYCLQQSLYKFVLEKNYNIKVDNMYLIIMYPDNNNYYKVEVPYLRNEIEHILETV